jgi:hypothetical protein
MSDGFGEVFNLLRCQEVHLGSCPARYLDPGAWIRRQGAGLDRGREHKSQHCSSTDDRAG